MASFVSTSIERLVNRIGAFAAILLMALGFAAPFPAVEQNVFNYDGGHGIAREHITEIGVAGTDALTPVKSAAPVATNRVVLRPLPELIAPNSVPQGFGSASDFGTFGDDLGAGLRGAGYDDVTAVFQGSSVTGRSFHTGAAFDVGRARSRHPSWMGIEMTLRQRWSDRWCWPILALAPR